MVYVSYLFLPEFFFSTQMNADVDVDFLLGIHNESLLMFRWCDRSQQKYLLRKEFAYLVLVSGWLGILKVEI